MVLLENPKTRNNCLIHFSAWDSVNDAIEFFEAYSERSSRRLGVSFTPAESTTRADSRLWRTPATTTFLERRGDKVLAIEALPRTLDQATPTLESELWKNTTAKKEKGPNAGVPSKQRNAK